MNDRVRTIHECPQGTPVRQITGDDLELQAAELWMVDGLARQARSLTGSDNLCLAGGVALNVLANAKILRESGFLNVWIQPAAGDSGGCIGAATHLYHAVLRQPRIWTMTDAYLGPGYSNDEIGAFLSELEVPHTVLRGQELTSDVARLLADGNVVGWFQGGMEWGPRALGHRSILADPRNPHMKDILNEKVKHRERFRPSAAFARPYAILGVAAVAADTDAEADRLATTIDLNFARRQKGEYLPLASPEEAAAYPYAPSDRERIRLNRARVFTCSVATVRKRLDPLIEATKAAQANANQIAARIRQRGAAPKPGDRFK